MRLRTAKYRDHQEGGMADKGSDPTQLWHAMLGEMEKGFNAFANQAMAAPQFNKVVDQVGDATAGAKKQLGEMMERYLASMSLPSRAQMVDFGARLEAIETQLKEVNSLLRQGALANAAPPAAATAPPAATSASASPEPAAVADIQTPPRPHRGKRPPGGQGK
jgi:hypothetical protein